MPSAAFLVGTYSEVVRGQDGQHGGGSSGSQEGRSPMQMQMQQQASFHGQPSAVSINSAKRANAHAGAANVMSVGDAKSWWLPIQNKCGNCNSLTPLHQASRNGQVGAVNLLLARGADVDRIDKAKIRGTALHHAVSTGQLDIVRILCEHGASLRYKGMGGEALDISEMCAGQEKAYIAQQSKVQEILREFDTRCSHCRSENPTKNCPCGKEKYCNVDCQRGRWKSHKKRHKELVGEKKK